MKFLPAVKPVATAYARVIELGGEFLRRMDDLAEKYEGPDHYRFDDETVEWLRAVESLYMVYRDSLEEVNNQGRLR